MPKSSERQQLLRMLVELIAVTILDAEDDEEDRIILGPEYTMNVGDEYEDGIASDLDDLMELLLAIEASRYIGPRRRFLKSRDFRTNFFYKLPDDEFRQLARVSKHAFGEIERMIQGNPVFRNKSHNKQAPVWFQLAIALDRLGNYGNGVSLGRTLKLWGIGKGTCVLYTDRVILALNAMAPEKIVWPNLGFFLELAAQSGRIMRAAEILHRVVLGRLDVVTKAVDGGSCGRAAVLALARRMIRVAVDGWRHFFSLSTSIRKLHTAGNIRFSELNLSLFPEISREIAQIEHLVWCLIREIKCHRKVKSYAMDFGRHMPWIFGMFDSP